MANHFCVLVLYDSVCDMDHKSAIKNIIIILSQIIINLLV